jgi:hypothetical protein
VVKQGLYIFRTTTAKSLSSRPLTSRPLGFPQARKPSAFPMMRIVMTDASKFLPLGCCGDHAIGSSAPHASRAWLVLAIMSVVVLRSSLICHSPVISKDTSIDALIAGSYCSTGGTTPLPPKGGENTDEHATCLHCASRRRFTTSYADESV